MSNLVDVVCTAVMALAARCMLTVSRLASGLEAVAVFSARCASVARSACASWLPLVGQQLVDPAVQLRRQPRKHVLEVRPGLMSVELGRLQQTHHDRRPLTRQLAADEEPVAPVMHLCP